MESFLIGLGLFAIAVWIVYIVVAAFVVPLGTTPWRMFKAWREQRKKRK